MAARKVVFVGLYQDLDRIEVLPLPDDREYSYCSQFEHVPMVDGSAEVVFVISSFHRVSSHQILLLEEVEKRRPQGERWLFRLDRSEVMYGNYPILVGVPEGPPWLKEVFQSSS